jgi:hypothetical protein
LVTERLQAHVPGGQRPSASPSELAILAGTFNFGFQLFYLADSEAVPAELLSTGRELLLCPLLESGPDTTARSSATEPGTTVS